MSVKAMSKEKSQPSSGIFSVLLQIGLYKKQQGRLARQVTCAAIVLFMAYAAYRMSLSLQGMGWVIDLGIKMGISTRGAAMTVSGLFFLLTSWIGYRIVNYPPFADFLISVEAEMNKVSWPSKPELVRSSMVVLFTVVFMAISLFLFDSIWSWFFEIVFNL